MTYRYTNEEDGKTLRRYWTTACQTCALKAQCTPGKERRISRWEHETVLETVQDRLDRNPDKMRVRRQTVEHPFGTIKAWMGATHFQMRRLPKVASEMALHVLAYNMKRVMQTILKFDVGDFYRGRMPRPGSAILASGFRGHATRTRKECCRDR